ncbi:MAG: efflux RND transporter periplasmic adaptor subunit [Rhodocyclales bacterium]|nr:efflux RND transporter periplasmic adaptor subunit [Rhodocyclales bacterium]
MDRHFPRSLALLALLLVLPAVPVAAAPPASVVVQLHAVSLGVAADGVVEALTQATVAAQVAGRIVELRVDAGQAVRKGELLLRIDAREAAEAATAARSQLVVAQAQFERSRQLRQQNFISQAGLDKARAEFDAAKAAAAQAGVGLGHAAVTSPITGVVSRRHAESGEMATLGRPLLTIHDPAGLRVTASIPQHRLREVRGARSARIEFPELGKVVEAASVQLLPTADAATHVSSVRVQLPPAIDGVVPGMAARVTFVTGTAEKMTVPAAAVVRRGEVTAVYVAAAQGPVLRQLRLGEAVSATEIEVLAGLAAGERVLLDPVQAAIALRAGR